MPKVPVVHLAGLSTAPVPGADQTLRMVADDGYLMPFKLKHLSRFTENFIFMDTDMLLTESVESVFDQDFDVAMHKRSAVTVTTNGEQSAPMPYNAGFMACRKPEFFADAHKICLGLEEKYRIWFGDQVAIAELAKQGRYKILDLDETWNHPVTAPDDYGAKVLHYKGPRRKPWMIPASRALGVCTM